jgi:hypothetical protein
MLILWVNSITAQNIILMNYRINALLTDFSSEKWAKSIPPIMHRFVTNIYASFVKQVFYITKRKWKPNIHHHSGTNNIGGCFKIAKGIGIFHHQRL